jgi:hypothetical protein
MRIPQNVLLWLGGVAIGIALLCVGLSLWRWSETTANQQAIPDLAKTKPLNQPGVEPAPAEAYEVYSALYQVPAMEPLAFAENSMTDIPQVDGSCLKPATPDEREMSDAFDTANRQSHKWEQKFTIPAGYKLLSRSEVARAQSCLAGHGRGTALCASYTQLRHVRFLGVPGFDRAHMRALVSVVKMCGSDCGSGGIFEVEKVGGKWQRAALSDFTQNCSWMY